MRRERKGKAESITDKRRYKIRRKERGGLILARIELLENAMNLEFQMLNFLYIIFADTTT